MRRVHTFVPIDSELEVQRLKRAGQEVLEEPANRQKIGEASRSGEEGFTEKEKEVKYPIIDWETFTKESKSYWRIIKVGNHTEVYQIFEDMLKRFDRDDLEKFWDLVKKRFRSTEPTVDKEKDDKSNACLAVFPMLSAMSTKTVKVVVRLPDLKLKTLGKRGIECIFVGYVEHSKALRFYVIEPNDSIAINSIIESNDDIFDEHSLIIHQMDVKTAFLNGELDEEVYMNQPQGFIMPGNENKVCKLIKSLYGLKQAPKQWHQKFDELVLSNGYLLNQAEKCLYRKFDETNKGVIICLYVDDMLIFVTGQVQVDLTKEFLSLVKES
ncbi:zinc finger, CCHC-type containing protein [Tanacetum coccineum]|uniref:Zinc finger, CCHC-type containing protein n=1 Tax=Tanacetum coccineum TaxID=301880 RepID=A0ABQ5I1Y4_9ASTR